MTLSAKHLQVRDFILEFQEVHGRKPLWKEMLAGLKMSNRSLRRHIDRLERAGELRLEYVAPHARAASV